MERYLVYAEGGSVKLGNESFTAHFSNGYGDGFHSVIYFDSKEEYEAYIAELCDKAKLERKWSSYSGIEKYKGQVEGQFCLYAHDCGDEIATRFNGRIGVYTIAEKLAEHTVQDERQPRRFEGNGTVALVKWD